MEGISAPAEVVKISSGIWAGMQFMRHGLNVQALRTNATLQREEWVHFDTVLVQEGIIRLRAVALLLSRGLTMPIANALGRTMIEYEKITDMQAAIRSMDGISRSYGDRVEYSQVQLPNFITHKDFDIYLRALEASRNKGEPLDTTQVRVAGRLVSESLENALINGAGVVINGVQGYGYRNHPNRNTGGFVTNGAWSAAAKVGADILEDTLKMITALQGDRHYGPYDILVPGDASVKLSNDFKANGDLTILQRLLEVDGVENVITCDQMPTANVVMVSATPDVVQLADGEGIQSVQWEIEGGMCVKFKALAIQVPIVKADAQGRSGVYHMS